jgi:hypothetical protein
MPGQRFSNFSAGLGACAQPHTSFAVHPCAGGLRQCGMELFETARAAVPDLTLWMIAAMVVVVAALGREASPDRRRPISRSRWQRSA